MSEGKQRSSLFKFFYIVLRVITFPIYVVIYILRHPLWVLFFVLLGLGILAYYPMSKGVHSSDIIKWYKDKYVEVKYDVVKTVVERVDNDFVPETLAKEVKKEKQRLDEEKEEAKRFKGDDYNAKVERQEEFENVVKAIKQRGGFKKKVVEVKDNTENMDDVGIEVDDNTNEKEGVGGLSSILKKMEPQEKEKVELAVQNDAQQEEAVAIDEVANTEENAVVEVKPTEEKADTDELGELDLL
jgi:hypothetical protein